MAKKTTIKVDMQSHKDDIKQALGEKIPRILEALGLEAEGNAITEITNMKAVDTGRLRNSITYATSEYSGKGDYTDDHGNVYSDAKAKGSPEEDTVYIGTNVEYAPYIEFGARSMGARPFLKNAVANYADDYKRIIKDGLK